ncbi:MAG: DMT family transporter [Cyclobacteriaceae bacterium]
MSSKQARTLAIFLAVIGVVLFSAKAVMVKLAYQYEVDPVSLLLLRMVFALPIYLIVAIVKRPSHPGQISSKDYLWLILFGIVGYYLASYFDFLGLIYIKASLERIILFIYPTLVLIISRIFLGKKIATSQVFAICISYLGIAITFWAELDLTGSNVVFGSILIFLSALTYACYLVGSGWLIPKFGATTFTSYAMIVSCLAVAVHFLVLERKDVFNFPIEVYGLSLAMAMLSTVIPSYLVSAAIKKLGASDFSIIGSLGPISTIILANLFLDESLTILQLVGTAVVIIGVFIVSRYKS